MILCIVLMAFSDLFPVRHVGSEVTKSLRAFEIPLQKLQSTCFYIQLGKYTYPACIR